MQKNTDAQQQSKSAAMWRKRVAIAVAGVLVLLVTIGGLVFCQMDNWETRGQFGDMFGIANALFSGLAFAGVIITIWMQREELELQRLELQATRCEIRGQREEMKTQNENLRRQRHNDTLFAMLGLHNDIANNVQFSETKVAVGRSAFPKFVEKFGLLFDAEKNAGTPEKQLEEAHRKFARATDGLLGQYFRNLHQILRFIDESFTDSEQAKYAALARAQLSSHEQTLLYYHCLVPAGKALKPLVEKFGLLSEMDENKILNGFFREAYDSRAFVKSE